MLHQSKELSSVIGGSGGLLDARARSLSRDLMRRTDLEFRIQSRHIQLYPFADIHSRPSLVRPADAVHLAYACQCVRPSTSHVKKSGSFKLTVLIVSESGRFL